MYHGVSNRHRHRSIKTAVFVGLVGGTLPQYEHRIISARVTLLFLPRSPQLTVSTHPLSSPGGSAQGYFPPPQSTSHLRHTQIAPVPPRLPLSHSTAS